MKKIGKAACFVAMAAGYAVIAILIAYVVYRGGDYPAGSDTMCHVYKGQILLEEMKKGNIYPLYDRYWYNGVQMMRYWAPLPVYFIAFCQALAHGSAMTGHLVFIALIFFFGGLSWLYIGIRKKRAGLGFFMGILWFFMPNNLYALFTEGNLPRSLSMVFLPLLLYHIYEWLFGKRKWKNAVCIIPVFALIALCHVGYAGMIALALLVSAVIYLIKFRNPKKILVLIGSLLLGFFVLGIWLYPSLKGGITSTDSSQVMATFFQSAWESLNPLLRFSEDSERFYYGLSAFIVAMAGVVAADKTSRVGFWTALLIFLGTTSSAYVVLVHLPGSQYLWMLRFISIALCLICYSLLMWKTLRKWILFLFLALLTLDCVPSVLLYMGDGKYTAQQRMEMMAEEYLIHEAREITVQRVALIDGSSLEATGQYMMTVLDGKKVAQSFGAGWQSAATAKNIVALNEAAERGFYDYLFDRALSLGNDTVLIKISMLKNKSNDLQEVERAAKKSGYECYKSNGGFVLYHRDVTGSFGVKSSYDSICIGTSSVLMSYPYPNMEEGYSPNLNDYSFEKLKGFKLIYLANFTYDDKKAAESLLLKLAKAGCRIVIDGNGIPQDTHNGNREFLGVSCQTIMFENGFPVLYANGKEVVCSLFDEQEKNWKTVYFNGLTNETGYLYDNGVKAAFMGTAKNENISFIGLNLPYHYFVSGDETGSGVLVDSLLGTVMDRLPERKIVPIRVDYGKDEIVIKCGEDYVNTTLAYHDIFDSSKTIYQKNQLLHVNRGTTTITMKYPYGRTGGLISIAALILCLFFIWRLKKTYGGPGEERSEQETKTAKKKTVKKEIRYI